MPRLFPWFGLAVGLGLVVAGCGNTTTEPGFATDEEYGYVATVWANIVDDVDGDPYAGGWELNLNVDPERAAETAGVRVIWPDGVTTTDLDPDFREGLHPLGSIFSETENSRFVKYGTGLGWPQKGTYTFQVRRTDGSVIELSVNYLHRLLGRPKDVEISWSDRFTLRVSFTPPPEATHWSVSLVNEEGSVLVDDATGETSEDGRVVFEFRDVGEQLRITAVGIALTNDQNILGAQFPMPRRP